MFVLKQAAGKEIAIHPEKVAHGMRAQGWEFSLSTRPAFKCSLVACHIGWNTTKHDLLQSAVQRLKAAVVDVRAASSRKYVFR